MPASLLRARASFWWGQRIINQGDIVASNDPVVKGREQLFETVAAAAKAPVTLSAEMPIERATAGPGEKRGLSTLRPRRYKEPSDG